MLIHNYTLGATSEEQKRLAEQAQLYGDLQYINFKKNDVICEVGCGPGSNIVVCESLEDGFYVGLDYNNLQIKEAKKKQSEKQISNAHFLCAYGDALPINSNVFDLVFCRLVLIHQPEPLRIINEMLRIVKVGGRIMAIEPYINSYFCSNKPFLTKCLKERSQYSYSSGRGCMDIAPQLYSFFKTLGLCDINLKQHNISVFGHNDKLMKAFCSNWLGLIRSVKDVLIENKSITLFDFEMAEEEAKIIKAEDFLYQQLWIIEGSKV